MVIELEPARTRARTRARGHRARTRARGHKARIRARGHKARTRARGHRARTRASGQSCEVFPLTVGRLWHHSRVHSTVFPQDWATDCRVKVVVAVGSDVDSSNRRSPHLKHVHSETLQMLHDAPLPSLSRQRQKPSSTGRACPRRPARWSQRPRGGAAACCQPTVQTTATWASWPSSTTTSVGSRALNQQTLNHQSSSVREGLGCSDQTMDWVSSVGLWLGWIGWLVVRMDRVFCG